MTRDEFETRYRLLRTLEGAGVRSHGALELATNEPVMVHDLGTVPGEARARLLDAVARLDEHNRRKVRAVLEVEGTPIVVTDHFASFSDLEEWLRARVPDAAPAAPAAAEPGDFTRIFGAGFAGAPHPAPAPAPRTAPASDVSSPSIFDAPPPPPPVTPASPPRPAASFRLIKPRPAAPRAEAVPPAPEPATPPELRGGAPLFGRRGGASPAGPSAAPPPSGRLGSYTEIVEAYRPPASPPPSDTPAPPPAAPAAPDAGLVPARPGPSPLVLALLLALLVVLAIGTILVFALRPR